MTDEQIARWAFYRLQALADKQLSPEQFEVQSVAIITDAACAGRREGEISGITRGVQHACDLQAFVRERCFWQPISAAEVHAAEPKAEETKHEPPD